MSYEYTIYFQAIVAKIGTRVVYGLIVLYDIKDSTHQTRCPAINPLLILI